MILGAKKGGHDKSRPYVDRYYQLAGTGPRPYIDRYYHTSQRSDAGRTMGALALQPKVC
jgi:hypothetical protein